MANPGTKMLGFWNLDALALALASNDHNWPCHYVRGDNEPESLPTGRNRGGQGESDKGIRDIR